MCLDTTSTITYEDSLQFNTNFVVKDCIYNLITFSKCSYFIRFIQKEMHPTARNISKLKHMNLN